jgi:DNA-binding response OmpR family regulator
MSRLLLVEDDDSLGATLKERLIREGHDVRWVQNQRDAIASIGELRFDLVILDVGLPDGSGFELARVINQSNSAHQQRPLHFIFVTAMNTAEHRLEGYELGAEEFIPKPFHLKEFLIRVRHVLATHAQVQDTQVVQFQNGSIDLSAQAVIGLDGKKEFLQARDFRLIKLLIDFAPRVVSRDEILDQVWGEDKFPSHRTVDNAIVRLRQALQDTNGNIIRSVRGVGYQWAPEIE